MTTFSMEALVKALHKAEDEEDDIKFMECMDELRKRKLTDSQEFREAYAIEWHNNHASQTMFTARIISRVAHNGRTK